MPTYWDFKIWCEQGLLTFAATGDKITVYKQGEPQPLVTVGEAIDTDWLQELICEIRSGATEFTESIFRSSRQALLLQKAAK